MKKVLLTLIIISALAHNTHAATIQQTMKGLTRSLRQLKVSPHAANKTKFLTPGTNVRWFSPPPTQNKKTRYQQQRQKRLQKTYEPAVPIAQTTAQEATKAYSSIEEALHEFNTIIQYIKANQDKLPKENVEKVKESIEKIRALLTGIKNACKKDPSFLKNPENILYIKNLIKSCIELFTIACSCAVGAYCLAVIIAGWSVGTLKLFFYLSEKVGI